MAYTKTAKRTDQEWKAYTNWFADPVNAINDWFAAEPDEWQKHALEALFKYKKQRIVIKSAHGVGKTTFDAWSQWIFNNCLKDSRVVLTAPVQAQLKDALIPECALWHSKMPEKMKREWVLSSEHIKNTSNPSVWFAVGRTSNKAANLQGFHNQYIMIIADEGSAIPEPVYEVIEGALSDVTDDEDPIIVPQGEERIAKLVITGNPNFGAGEMFNAFGKNKHLYHRITVTGDPELLDELGIASGEYHEDHGYVFLSNRVTRKYARNMADKYGKDSAVYDVRVRGIFPRFSDEFVISYANAMRATGLELPLFDAVADRVTLVVDPARGGMSETVIGWFRRGICYRLEGYKTSRTTEVTAKIQAAVLELVASGLRLQTIIIDEPGVGGGVIDECVAVGLPVTPYNGSKPMVRGQDPEEDMRLFQNVRARDWWTVRRRLELGNLPLPNDEILIAQGTSVKYRYNTSEKVQVESKEDLKGRIGKDASPDRFDVIVMGTAPWYSPAAATGGLNQGDYEFGNDRETMDEDL